MNSIEVEPEEMKRRKKEDRAIKQRNYKLLRQLGFKPILDNDHWMCGAIRLDVKDRIFCDVEDLTLCVFHAGADSVRNQILGALKIR